MTKRKRPNRWTEPLHGRMSVRRFVAIWNRSDSAAEVARRVGVTRAACVRLARRLRGSHALKCFVRRRTPPLLGDAAFIAAWNQSSSVADASDRTGRPAVWCSKRAYLLRRRGLPVVKLKAGRKRWSGADGLLDEIVRQVMRSPFAASA